MASRPPQDDYFETLICHLFSQLALNKALSVASTPYFLDLLASHVVNRVSLNSVTKA